MPIQLSGSLVITGSITTTGVITMSGSIASASYSSNSDLLFLLSDWNSTRFSTAYLLSSDRDFFDNLRFALGSWQSNFADFV